MQSNAVVSRRTIVLARSPGGDEPATAFEKALLAALPTLGCPVLVVPHLYYIASDHPAAARLATVTGPVLIAAWLHPRASRWILSALGSSAADIAAVDLRAFQSSEECVQALANLAGADAVPPDQASGARCEQLCDPVRERWYPVIDYDRCRNCKQCLDFCLFGVYTADADDSVRVCRPDNCKNGCPACSRVCPASAIMFPHYDGDDAIAGGSGLVGAPGEADRAVAPRATEDRPQAGSHPFRRRAAEADQSSAPRDDLDALIDELDALDGE